MYTIHMKRTKLVLDEQLLETATRLLGTKTYSAAVNKALTEAIRMVRIQQLSQFIGKDIWKGELSKMREDVMNPTDKSGGLPRIRKSPNS